MDSLQQIVKALTPNEKRYFNVFASAFKEESRLVKLFEVLDSADDYDEKTIQKKAKSKNLTEDKSHLRKLILKAMRNYREEISPKQQVRNTLADIEFFFQKGLHEEGRKEIHKAWKLAEKTDAFVYSPELLHYLAAVIARTLKPDKLVDDFSVLHNMMKESVIKLGEFYPARIFASEVTTFVRSSDYEMVGFSQQLNALIGRQKKHLDSTQHPFSRVLTLIVMGVSYHAAGEIENAENTYRQCRELYKQHPDMIAISPLHYLDVLNNSCLLALSAPGKKETAQQLLNESDEGIKMVAVLKTVPAGHQGYVVNLLSNKLLFTKSYSAWEMLDELEREVTKHLKPTSGNAKMVNVNQLMILISCFFYKGDYEKALEWVNIYYTQEDNKKVRAMFLCVRILEVFSFYANKQYDLSETKAVNLYKTFNEQELNDNFYKLLGTLLRKLNHWDKKNEKDRLEMETLNAAFEKLEKENDSQYLVYSNHIKPQDILLELLSSKK